MTTSISIVIPEELHWNCEWKIVWLHIQNPLTIICDYIHSFWVHLTMYRWNGKKRNQQTIAKRNTLNANVELASQPGCTCLYICSDVRIEINKHKRYPSMSTTGCFETTIANYGDFACRSGKTIRAPNTWFHFHGDLFGFFSRFTHKLSRVQVWEMASKTNALTKARYRQKYLRKKRINCKTRVKKKNNSPARKTKTRNNIQKSWH